MDAGGNFLVFALVGALWMFQRKPAPSQHAGGRVR
jgi:hypothetical protein